jgi:hypothetical protein
MVGFDQGYPRQSLLVNAQPGELVEGCLSLWTGARCDGAGSQFKFALNGQYLRCHQRRPFGFEIDFTSDTFARCYTYDRQDDFAPIRGWASYRFAPAMSGLRCRFNSMADVYSRVSVRAPSLSKSTASFLLGHRIRHSLSKCATYE